MARDCLQQEHIFGADGEYVYDGKVEESGKDGENVYEKNREEAEEQAIGFGTVDRAGERTRSSTYPISSTVG